MRRPRYSTLDVQITMSTVPNGAVEFRALVRVLNAALGREAARLGWDTATGGMASNNQMKVAEDDEI